MQSRNPVLRHATEQAKADPGAGSGALASEGQAAYNAATQGAASMSAEQLQEMYDKSGPNAGAVRGGEVAMTLNDVIVKTAGSFVVLLAGAVFGWLTADTMPWLMIVALFVGLGLGLANAFRKQVSPALVLAYALVQGVFLGAISQWYYEFASATNYGGNIVVQAVIGTLVAFGVMLLPVLQQDHQGQRHLHEGHDGGAGVVPGDRGGVARRGAVRGGRRGLRLLR